jgi:organic radical activating enzyme
MKHYLINPTWRCQNHCPYCWVRKSVKQRPEMVHAPERPLADWIAAIQRDRPEMVDIAGGEPLLTGWIPELVLACPETRFGLSTNGLADGELQRLAHIKPRNLLSVALSYHPDSEWPHYEQRWRRAAVIVGMAWGHRLFNVVDYADNVARAQGAITWLQSVNGRMTISPYEETDDLDAMQPTGLTCQGGVTHLVIAPDGATWPCLTTMRSPLWRETCIGNWLDGELDLSRKPEPCHLYCADYYILGPGHEAGDMWGTKPRPIEGGE